MVAPDLNGLMPCVCVGGGGEELIRRNTMYIENMIKSSSSEPLGLGA